MQFSNQPAIPMNYKSTILRISLALVLVLPIKTFAQDYLQSQFEGVISSMQSYGYYYLNDGLMPMAASFSHGNQMQHDKDNWRIKYKLSTSASFPYYSVVGHGEIRYDEVPGTKGLVVLGPRNGAFGGSEASTIRAFLLNNEGERIVHPETGQFISYDIEVPGGTGSSMWPVPSSLPYLQVRALAGLSFSGSYFPLGQVVGDLRELESPVDGTFMAFGVNWQLRGLLKVPVISWLRFDYSMNRSSFSVQNLHNLFNYAGDMGFLEFQANQYDMNLEMGSNQGRVSISVPFLKGSRLIGQVSQVNLYTDYHTPYDFDIKLDQQKLKEDYDLTLENAKDEYKIQGEFKKREEANFTTWNVGLLKEGRIGNYLLMYGYDPYPRFTAVLGIKLL